MILAQQYLPRSSWEFWGLLVVLLANNIPSILAYIQGIKNHRQGKKNSQDIADVALKVNGKMEQLLAVSSVADKATGRQEERHHYESMESDAVKSGHAIVAQAEAKALAMLADAEAKARDVLRLAATPAPTPAATAKEPEADHQEILRAIR